MVEIRGKLKFAVKLVFVVLKPSSIRKLMLIMMEPMICWICCSIENVRCSSIQIRLLNATSAI